MELAALILWTASLFAPLVAGPVSVPARQAQTFHVRGTVKYVSARVPKVKVTFRRGESAQSVLTDDSGEYETDLPVGEYTMEARGRGFNTYRRPLFRVSEPSKLTLDINLQSGGCGDMVITNGSGGPPTDAEIYEAMANCRHEDLFPWSEDEGRFQLLIQFDTRTQAGDVYSYGGASLDDPVALAYNVFSLRADYAVYDAKKKTLEARGNVVVEDESGRSSAEVMAYRLEDGRAIRL